MIPKTKIPAALISDQKEPDTNRCSLLCHCNTLQFHYLI